MAGEENVEAGLWARVKYSDGMLQDVPISFFKDRAEVEPELSLNRVRSQYIVFWSPKEDDTPAKVITVEGRIVEVFALKKTLATNASKLREPIKGWYLAELLAYSTDSLQDLLQKLEEKESRRPLRTTEIPPRKKTTTKAAVSRSSRMMRERARINNLKRRNVSEQNSTDTNLVEKANECVEDKSASIPESKDQLSDSIQTAEQYRDTLGGLREHLLQVSGERDRLLEENYSLKKKLVEIEEERKVLLELNTQWQQKELKRKASACNSKLQPSKKMQATPFQEPQAKRALFIEENNTTATASPNDGFLLDLPDEIVVDDLLENGSFITIDKAMDCMDSMPEVSNEQPQPQHSLGSSLATTVSKMKNIKKTTGSLGGIVVNESEYTLNAPKDCPYINHRQFLEAARDCKVGEPGDSLFVKNLCKYLWTTEEIAQRSSAGFSCPTKADGVQLKEATPAKKQYLSQLLELRCLMSTLKPTPEEIKQRIAQEKIKKYLRGKIKAAQLSLRMKK